MRNQQSRILANRAARMRAAPTATEALLWEELKGSRLGGVAFRRQAVIGRYIADFVAVREKLVVEVDGGYHVERAKADARRDRELGRLGYRVLRVSAEIVARDIERVRALVLAALGRADP